MNLFENLQLMKELDERAKRIYEETGVKVQFLKPGETDELYEMAKLTPNRADKETCGELDLFIYFSPCLDSHGPRVKFYGGSAETRSTKTSPSYTFGTNGAGEPILADWMNKKNCPNGYNKKILNQVENFINKTLPVLLLVWFEKLDESDALAYFQGHDTFEEMLNCIIEEDNEVKQELLKCKDLKELHEFCKKASMYSF